MAERIPVIAVTMGDPAGIGPELAVRAADSPRWEGRARFVIYGVESVLLEAAKRWSGGRLPRQRRRLSTGMRPREPTGYIVS